MTSNRKRTPEVIDLLGDDSDDEVRTVSSKKPASKPTSSEVNPRDPAFKRKRKSPTDQNSKQNSNTCIKSTTSQSTSKRASLKTSGSANTIGITFNVATYNVWFGPPHPEERMFALTQALLAKNTPESPLLFVGFQEVTPVLWSTLKPVLESAGYKVFCQDLSMSQYGCALAVLQTSGLKILSYGWQPYKRTIMHRGFLYVRAQLPNSSKQVLFTTTHLESFVGNMGGTGGGGQQQPYTGSSEREQQVQELETFCRNNMGRYSDLSLAMISGDLNWDDERIQSKGNDKTLPDVLSCKYWKDTWFDVRDRRRQAAADRNGRIRKKDEPTCFTYDAKTSAMLGGNMRRRFDRILTRQQNGVSLNVDDMELVGREPIDGLTWKKESQWNGRVTTKVVPVLPSDHFGYVVTLTL